MTALIPAARVGCHAGNALAEAVADSWPRGSPAPSTALPMG